MCEIAKISRFFHFFRVFAQAVEFLKMGRLPLDYSARRVVFGFMLEIGEISTKGYALQR